MLIKKSELKSLKIGVILPQSKQYPEAAGNFLNGIKLYFTLADNLFERGKAELIVEDVGYGTENLSIEKAHKLMSQDQVIMLTGLLEPMVGAEVGKMTNLADLPTFFAGLGESAVLPSNITNNLYFNTLQFWQSYYFLGQYVGEKLNHKPLTIITSFYDCGYDPLKAFRLGFLSKGNSIEEEIILKANSNEELQIEVQESVKFKKDHTYALILHPRILNQFIDQFGDKMEDIVTTPFYTGSTPNKKYWGFPNWRNKTAAFQQFSEGTRQFLDREADMFHLLGYQQGQLIYSALSNLGDPVDDNKKICEAWEGFQEDTLIGPVYLDKETHAVRSNINVFSGANSVDQFEIEETYNSDFKLGADVGEVFEIRNSFTNPYLFF